MRFQNRIILGAILVLPSATLYAANVSATEQVTIQPDAEKIARMMQEIESKNN